MSDLAPAGYCGSNLGHAVQDQKSGTLQRDTVRSWMLVLRRPAISSQPGIREGPVVPPGPLM